MTLTLISSHSSHLIDKSIEEQSRYPHRLMCNVSFDVVSCWPSVPAGSVASIPCFKELLGVEYDASRKYFQISKVLSISFFVRKPFDKYERN